ncbi:MAG: DUF3383 domain-containing protein [Turicibacter sp.]|nr:DUF3383 domain-containing protein [Turicibacter sp.]
MAVGRHDINHVVTIPIQPEEEEKKAEQPILIIPPNEIPEVEEACPPGWEHPILQLPEEFPEFGAEHPILEIPQILSPILELPEGTEIPEVGGGNGGSGGTDGEGETSETEDDEDENSETSETSETDTDETSETSEEDQEPEEEKTSEIETDETPEEPEEPSEPEEEEFVFPTENVPFEVEVLRLGDRVNSALNGWERDYEITANATPRSGHRFVLSVIQVNNTPQANTHNVMIPQPWNQLTIGNVWAGTILNMRTFTNGGVRAIRENDLHQSHGGWLRVLELTAENRIVRFGWTRIWRNRLATADESLPFPWHPYLVPAEPNPNLKTAKIAFSAFSSIPMQKFGGSEYEIIQNETAAAAVRACRAANTDWYTITYLGATSDEIVEIARYIESEKLHSLHFYTTDEDLVLTNQPTSVFRRLRDLGFMRSIGQFSRTPFAVCGIVGVAMGLNTRTSRSAFTLMHKRPRGIAPDKLTQVENLRKISGNYFISRGFDDSYSMFESGETADRTWCDEVINLDMLVNDLQRAILDLFISHPKIAKTEEGVNTIKLAMQPALEKARLIGFIAPGVWNGGEIYTENHYAPIRSGTALPLGYRIVSEPVDLQSQADRDTRLSPPIYVAIKLAGAIHSVAIRIDVNR